MLTVNQFQRQLAIDALTRLVSGPPIEPGSREEAVMIELMNELEEDERRRRVDFEETRPFMPLDLCLN